MASGEKPTEAAPPTTSTTREKFSAFKNRAATHYTRVKQVFFNNHNITIPSVLCVCSLH